MTILNSGATSTNSTDEAYLDIETSGGMAPGAAIRFYAAEQLGTAITAALSDNKADILNLSFGECELLAGNAENLEYFQFWQQAAMQGISVTVSAGDTDSAGCDAKTAYPATQGLAVSGLTSTPYNVSVGGTDTYALVNDFNAYVSATDGAALFTAAR